MITSPSFSQCTCKRGGSFSSQLFLYLTLTMLVLVRGFQLPHGTPRVMSSMSLPTFRRYNPCPLFNDYTATCEKQEQSPVSPTPPFPAAKIIEETEDILNESAVQNGQREGETARNCVESMSSSAATSRRLFFASGLVGAGAMFGADLNAAWGAETLGNLKWEATPVNKRTGVTVFDAEKYGYNVPFVTYLSRFLLCFDEDCQRWWYSKAADLPRLAKAEQIEGIRLQQFAAFSASVEVGLQFYRGPDGPKQLLGSLLKRYCPDLETIRAYREEKGLSPLTDSAEAQEQREIKEARRQLALLFGLMEKNQPVDEISKILAAIDNGSIASVNISDPGSGYAPGYGPPFVQFPPPDAGPDYETATGRAILRPNGKILRLDIINRGFGYSKPPTIEISPPQAAKFGNDTSIKPAEAKAFLFKVGGNKGRLERIQLTEPGSGYREDEIIKVKISPPEMSPKDGGVTGTATAILEYEVGGIKIVNGGSGYVVEKPINVYVEPPPVTARINMNDPMMAQMIPADDPIPSTTIPSKNMKKKMPDMSDPSSITARIQRLALGNDGTGGGGGCIGRGCYDNSVLVTAYARAEKDSFNSFRDKDDAFKNQQMEMSVMRKAEGTTNAETVSGSSSGSGGVYRLAAFGSGSSSSAQLLSLLPEGIGLQFDKEAGRYVIRATQEIIDTLPTGWFDGSGNRPLDPEFGPRGRSPVEREKSLGIDTYLRFVASGAVCCSGVHLALTPIDVVKTKVQSNPKEYPGVVRAFKKVLAAGGPTSFFTGWAPTFVGFFVWGGAAYGLTEFLRRTFTELAGSEASNLEVPIIFGASAIAAVVGSYILCPFEAARIRLVAQSGSKKTIFDVLKTMIKEEGIGSLFSAVPAFILKEIPFNAAKFVVFDLSTAAMYNAFPVAQEDLQLSLLVSLAGGTLGGISAAIVSNPADATVTEMKKAKSDIGPVEAFQILLDQGGPTRLLAGLSLRMVFYSLIVSLQFLVYDAVRFALGIGSDDLKLYLDVLGGALSETGGPV